METCGNCGEQENHWWHDEEAAEYSGHADPEHDCNYDADYQDEETGYVGSCDHHEFEEEY